MARLSISPPSAEDWVRRGSRVADTSITELPTAEDLIGRETDRYWDWGAGLAAVPVVTDLRAQMERVREREVSEAMRRLSHLSPADREAVEQLSRSMMNKFLHEPSVRLKSAAANGRGLGVVDAARYLFGLAEKKDETSGGPSESEGQ